MGRNLAHLVQLFVQSLTRLYYAFPLFSFAIGLALLSHFLLPILFGFSLLFSSLSKSSFLTHLSMIDLYFLFVLELLKLLRIVPTDSLIFSLSFSFSFLSSFFSFPFVLPLVTPAIYSHKQEQPYYVYEVPIPCCRFEPEVVLFCEMVVIQPYQTHCQKTCSNKHVEPMESCCHIES